ncbi:MAG: glycosyltransferase family 1 protein [Candidatus Levyibacteriota bacterium]
MNIAIDMSPLRSGNFLQHRVRGTGFYLKNLKNSLGKYYPQNSYTFFSRGEKLHKSIDLVHYPYFEPFFLTLPPKIGSKTVVTVHDLTPLVFPRNFPSGIKGRIKWHFQRSRLKKASAIITDSNSSKRDIVRFTKFPENKIAVVYLAAGEEFKRLKTNDLRLEEVRRKYNLPSKFALYVGDVTWNKNLPVLIEAAKIAKIPLVMVGKAIVQKEFDKTNPWNQDLVRVQSIIKNQKHSVISPQSSITSQIFVLGFVPQDDLVVLYNLATVFIIPSLYEGFGLPILEAMSCGCPVVTSKEGSIPEVAGDAALYVDAYDKASITEGIKEVFNSESLRKELSEKGLKQARKFSWKKTAEETVKVYEKVIK